ncbi:M23 family metallopeptidase [Desertifilum sp. FACHB-1129]|uniref:M23ase beta-sheet core domain-containing protein n=2 Tax=Cyanophyceae TaxID=3028117 RepID=A0A1E5QPP1_9CYAN|nr:MULTISPECIES: M23 family metallopeptidase [Cyanophyceae]MCD8490022.1 M23 family metallopeptidase [Desertifilum sp.]MDA0209800.1 M23 family metallopeptidase [Cyanobacteria bacterium FC1]MDI9635983.1 M23 family metallopeptidase [Geitlerinema splendidum]MBD2310709.1 M23 family metallopeptidase [Desertifilum sp. FACHB-1129]MBD2320746.1 M23 family metallopeptidase [Desertifilum sp. FACHB-866]
MRQKCWLPRLSTTFLQNRVVFFLAGLSLAILFSLAWHPHQVSATEIARAADWRSASFPVENFVDYTSPFGYRRSVSGAYSREFHYGLDLAAPEGSYIRSWWSGKVVEVWEDNRCGTGIAVESGSWDHIYCHMKGNVRKIGGVPYLIDSAGGLRIAQGQAVEAGTRIGRVGMSGRTTGPHLHWGLKYSNQWVDPALVLRAMYTQQAQRASS